MEEPSIIVAEKPTPAAHPAPICGVIGCCMPFLSLPMLKGLLGWVFQEGLAPTSSRLEWMMRLLCLAFLPSLGVGLSLFALYRRERYPFIAAVAFAANGTAIFGIACLVGMFRD